MDKSPEIEGAADNLLATESPTVAPLPAFYETEINELKEAIIRKDGVIQEQKSTIDRLKADRNELVNRSETSSGEIKDERKLLAVLIEREMVRIKNLVEVG